MPGLLGGWGRGCGAARGEGHRGWWHHTWPIGEEEASHVHELIVIAVPAVLPGLLPPRPVLPEGQLVPALGDNSRAWLVLCVGCHGALCCATLYHHVRNK